MSSVGLVTSGRSTGQSVVLVEYLEDFGVTQRVVVDVDVKPVSFVMINVLAAFSPAADSGTLAHLPKGITLPMGLSYHDNTGEIAITRS